MQSLQDGIQYFEEAVPIVVKALDNVAKIHPFIGSGVYDHKAQLSLTGSQSQCVLLEQLMSLRRLGKTTTTNVGFSFWR